MFPFEKVIWFLALLAVDANLLGFHNVAGIIIAIALATVVIWIVEDR